MACECEFDPYPPEDEDAGEESWHFRRTCTNCGGSWFGLHCPYDGHQNPCPHCGVNPEPEPDAD
jgi:hypothetical protein